jgi:hypothetical protein
MPTINVHNIDLMTEGSWSFNDVPSVVTYSPKNYGRGTFDPFPAYAHKLKNIQDAVEDISASFPPLWDVDLYSMNREEVGRSNGYSNVRETGHYEGDDYVKDPITGVIVLSGKRIPPHPAITWYLVAHEYGHNVEYMLNSARGARTPHSDDLITEYARLRGLPPESVHHGSGGRWHDSAAEIFACDFRILICNVEVDYWPHPDIPRPELVTDLADWWWAQRSAHDSYSATLLERAAS